MERYGHLSTNRMRKNLPYFSNPLLLVVYPFQQTGRGQTKYKIGVIIKTNCEKRTTKQKNNITASFGNIVR